MSTIERMEPPGGMSISEAVVVARPDGKDVHVSGQILFDPEVGYVDIDADMQEQATRVFDQIESILGRQGGGLANVVSITAYLTSFDEYREYSRIRGERFLGNLPASTAVQVAGLMFNASLEVTAVAFIPSA